MKKFFKILIWIIVIAVFAGTFIFLYNNSKQAPDTYELITPETGTIERSTVLTGKIEPRDEIEIKPQISGIISEILIEAGDYVHEGDIIAKIKVIPNESSLSAAQNQVDVCRLTYNQAKQEFGRTEELYKKKFVSREEYEQAQTAMLKAKEELNGALDNLSIVRDGVSTLNAQQSNTLVRATIDGQILEVPVKVGSSVIQANTMNDGTTIAKIADMRRLIFVGKVDETEVGMLRPEMPVSFTIGALSDITPCGEIEYISPKSTEENGSNTFEVKASIQVPDSVTLRAGYSANASVSLLRKADVLTITEAALEYAGDSTFVYVLTAEAPEQKFERRPVVTGVSDGVKIEVKSGVNENDRLRGIKIESK